MSQAGLDPWGVTDQAGWSPSDDQAREAILGIAPGATITSQARTPEHNAEVGGVGDSMHLGDQAADFVLPKGMTAAQVKKTLQDQGYPVTEFLDEWSHVHWGWGAKGGKSAGAANDPWAPAQGFEGFSEDELLKATQGRHFTNTPAENAALDEFEAAKPGSNDPFAPDPWAPKEQPSPGWMEVLKSAVTSTPARWKAMAGGLLQSLGEQIETGTGFAVSGDQEDSLAAAQARAKAINAPAGKGVAGGPGTTMAKFGSQLYGAAMADVKANMPNLDDSQAKRIAYQITAGTIDMLPVLAASAVTENPVVGGAMMAAQSSASKYGEARANGRSVGQAQMDAGFTGMVNGTLGVIPLGLLMKPGQTFLAKTLQGAASFGVISVATEALQLGYDKGLVTPNMTLKDAWGRLEEAGIVGTLQGAFLGGGHAGLESAVARFHARTPAPAAERAEPAPASPQQPPAPQPAPQVPTSIRADVRRSMGLDRPGRAPEVDPWAPAPSAGYEAPSPAAEALNREFPRVPTPPAAAVEGPGIPRVSLEPDVAVTSSGREVPVEYAIVDASHLIPSQTQEGNINPAFPQELQPRDRTRATSQAQIASIAQNINPRLLDRSVTASDGAPIVAPSGVVESGNGRTLAIQRAYQEGMPSARQYREYLADQGYPVEGVLAPVLVRVRTGEMAPDERQAFVREANQAGQLSYSATERAMSDAAAMPDHAMALFRGGDVEAAANRDFVRAFMNSALPTAEHGAMVDANGSLSLDGARRVRAAMLAKAYSDPSLVGSVVENADSSIKAIGNALTDSAPDWAMMRAAAARGEIPGALDQTDRLLEAVQLVARARQDGRNVAEFVAQPDIFSGQAIDPDTEAWLRLMFRNTQDWTQPVGRDKLAEALQFYAREAQKAQMGQNLLGEQPVSAGEVLSVAKARQYGQTPSGTGPSLSFGEDLRARRLEGEGSGPESPEARGSAQNARPGLKGDVEAPFGRQPSQATFRKPEPGQPLELGGEAWDYLHRAGIDPKKEPAEAVAALANWVYRRGHQFGFESLGALTGDGGVFAGTDGRKAAVNFSNRILNRLLDRTQQVVTVHNHPSNSSFSHGDVASLAYPGHRAMVVVGHDGEWHLAALTATLHGGDINAQAGMLRGAHSGARHVATKFVDRLYNERQVNGNDADHMLSAIAMLGLERAGVIRYMGPVRIAARYLEEVQHVVNQIAASVRLFLEGKVDQGVRAGERGPKIADRPARPLQFADGVAQILGQPRPNAEQSGGGAGAPAGEGRSAIPRKPEQLKLLEEKNRYEADRPPFYSALTRSIKDVKMSRAPAKDWLGLIDNLRAKGVKQEEIDWSGVKDWLARQTGPVARDQVLQHLRENEVQVREVERGGNADAAKKKLDDLRPQFTEMLERHDFMGFDTRGEAASGVISDPDAWDYDTPADRDLAHHYAAAFNLSRMARPDQTKFSSYVLPGGENYRELLLTLPEGTAESRRIGNQAAAFAKEMREKYGEQWLAKSNIQESARYSALVNRQAEMEGRPYRSGHFDEPNILAHVRFDDRTGPNGEKVLHVAEIQSDWHQKGRRSGYMLPESRRAELDARRVELEKLGGDLRGEGKEIPPEVKAEWAAVMNELQPHNAGKVPDAPFKSSWQELAAKRMLRYAAEHGYDRLSWDTGETQAARYDLSKQVDAVTAEAVEEEPGVHFVDIHPRSGGPINLEVENGKVRSDGDYEGKDLADVIGKDLADKILAMPLGERNQYTGIDLKVGGHGMKGFYDRILPNFLNKYAKKWGAKVEDINLPTRDNILPEGGRVPPDRMHLLSEAQKESLKPITQDAHSLPITPAMRESVMQGQPLFEDRRRYAEEPGAVDAQGRQLPQSIIPGAELSAVQLAKARDGRMGSKAEQKPPGGLFGAQGVPGDEQLSLFEEERRYAELPREDRETLERTARTGDWIGKYDAKGATPDGRIRNAIAAAFRAWSRSASSVPQAVRPIFRQIDEGAPHALSDTPTTRPTEAFREKVKRAAADVMDLVHDAQMLIAPMAEGTSEARATAKNFANMMRLARWHGQRMSEGLKKTFSREQLRRMWEAADEESVLRQKGEPTAGRGLSTLSPEERRAVLEQQVDAQAVWKAAKDQGMVEGEGLPSYVPRMMVEMGTTGVQRLGAGGEAEARSIPGIGRNLRTRTAQMLRRKHLTTEETEQAGSDKFGTMAHVVRDIRTLPLATMRLREAVAGRALINKIKEIGQKTGDDTVVEGHEPADSPYSWFTLNHPAFKTWRPKLIKNEETGKYEAAKDQNGNTVFEKVPLYVRGDFEGPLRAVLSQDSGKVYNALMNMKGRAMTAIMYSPLIHNAVEWGRALPAMPGKVFTLRVYFEGNRAKRDPETMTQAIMHGLVPIGHQAGYQDITSIANLDSIRSGRSWTAKALGAIPGLFSRDAQDAVYRAVDRMGDLWHNTLLWDRVGDLQMGLYVNLRDHMIAKGNSPEAAQYTAAHFANRYAGALPLEAMSTMARKIANLTLFSRTYTLGNLGAMKDIVTGLPRDVQAQIAQSGSLEAIKGVRGMAARKALSILLVDVALFYAGNSILQSAMNYLSGRKDLEEEARGYVDRVRGLLSKVTESPLELLNPFADAQAVSATSENEPGRQNRILVGYDHDGTAIYARNPVGKIGEEFTNWLTSPLQTLKSKFSTFLRPTYAAITNDAGFGRHVYDPNAKGISGIVQDIGSIAKLYLDAQIPVDSLNSAKKALMGQGSVIDTYKAVGPLAGVTFSKGAPGGPGVGELFDLRTEQDAKIQAALPGIIEKIRQGDVQGARADMRGLGISPGLQNYYVRVTKNPRLRLQTRSARQLLRQATPEQRARILQPGVEQ